jgi:hypothetical protein
MKAPIKTIEVARNRMKVIVDRALARQGRCSREDWLKQLELFHGTTRGYAPRKQKSPVLLTKAG